MRSGTLRSVDRAEAVRSGARDGGVADAGPAASDESRSRMQDPSELVRTLSADEAAALAPLPESDEESPTTVRPGQGAESTAEAHRPGVMAYADAEASGADGPPNPRDVEEQ
jgi:hypothetical protein